MSAGGKRFIGLIRAKKTKIGRIRPQKGAMYMAVRVRVRISVGDRSLETIALVNTGYEAETPQILVPIPAAEALGAWPPQGAFESTYETAGGPLRTWVYPRGCRVKIVAEGPQP